VNAMADWPATEVELREWVFIVAAGHIHENLNCETVWTTRSRPQETIFISALSHDGHETVLDDVCRRYGCTLCDWCYLSREVL
jgi:hypothetical protein